MLVLKTGETLRATLAGGIVGTATVVYWSIDASNVWTPHSVQTTNMGLSQPTPDIILLAPSGGEVVRVVENMYIMLATAAGSARSIFIGHFVGSAQTVLGGFHSLIGGEVVAMSRDGLFSIQTVFAP